MTTQLDASIGLKKETTYGTGVTVDRHFEFMTESLDYQLELIQGGGLRSGSRFPRSTRRSIGKYTAGGAFEMEAYSRGMGPIFEAAFGSGTSTVISGAAYQQLYTPGTTADPLPSYTIQKGLPRVGGASIATADTQTFVGAQCNTLELSCEVGGILKVATEWKAKNMGVATAYATPSYPSSTNGQIFTFIHGAITIGGTVTAPTTTALATGGTAIANITAASVKLDNNLDDEGFYFGGAGLRGRPSVVQYTEDSITGSFTAEYTDNVLRDAYIAQTELAMVLTFQGTTAIVASNYPTIQVYVPAIKLDGEVPKANGGNVVTVNAPFHGFDNTVATSPIYLAYVTADTAI
jgi:hypothetical protein